MKFSINQIRTAYESAADTVGAYYQLTAAIKIEMCHVLNCEPKDLQSWIDKLTEAQFERAFF